MKKKAVAAASPVPVRHVVWLSWKLVFFFSFALFFYALLLLHFSPEISPPTNYLSRARLRSRIPRYNNFNGTPKIAFLFLSRFNLPLDFLWGSFFENADTANFSIYIHSAPGFVFDESTSRSHFFYNRQLTDSIQVSWGESSMIEAERLLLSNALEDPANQRFVLLSESCVPLYNFSYIYRYLMASPRSFVDSFVDSFLDLKDGRYHPKMSPVVPRNKWRKGSQWISLIRSHAEVVVDDEVVLPVFKKFCKRRPPVDTSKGRLNIKLQKQHNCIPDEHYVPTLFAMSGLEGEIERRSLTYTLWNQSATKMDNKAWHPVTFNYADVSPKRLKEIKDINHIYYESESRTEWCRVNSTSVACFLFTRKFSRGAALRLLSEGVVAPFDTSSLLGNSS
ncbi:glycosyltransferase BC10-like [Hibiscus syriacus]|uniref:glycosyltransferase BC10-like n=1 Tax=Hibiscus syriacus TaxID=106335 RepID=UPI00192419E7|nr:glycosyltransferase BC10-like [Hibiscus syriacus]